MNRGSLTIKLLPLLESRARFHKTDFEESVAKEAGDGDNSFATYGENVVQVMSGGTYLNNL